MGRLVTYDSVVQEKLNSIIKQKNVQSGLIIGQCTDQKDIVIRLCPTPQKDDSSEPKNDDQNQKEAKNKPSKDAIELDEQWICQHAKQLMRALPGGLNILGLYIAAPSDYTIKQQALHRQILFAIFKTLNKSEKLNYFCSKERVLLNICTVTSKIVCRTFDVNDYKSSANPAEWKLQSGNLRWQQVKCQLAVDIKFPIKKESGSLSLQKQIEIGLDPFFKSIQDAYTLLNGLQRDSSELLDTSGENKKSKKKQSSDRDKFPSECHNIELFIPLENNNSINPEVIDCVCMMICKGAVQCRAYVHGKATVGDAINALKQDIIRSITARCEIHCEDLLLIEEEQKDPLVVHELPRRVFACLPQSDVCVCDYQFHSDTASDSLDAFKELLDLELAEQDIDMSCEISPTTSTLILPEVMEDRLSEFGDAPSHSPMNLYVPIAGVVATIAVGVASYMIGFNNS
ncbi:protein odr-4 homolog [Caerostris darwini]|uniref:Protein odr-4 homolog n=1 Tax=Caerostris darwini TaxID=1538125 RepID=A0AAV4UEC4_9ARAC|nr:protein odr-4 homolog [Caerostris darwini]